MPADDWDEVNVEGWSAAKDALFIGPCPHDWLFQRVAGVVHHGGAGMPVKIVTENAMSSYWRHYIAGTTAAGLRYGCPTWVCPFFGDQHFWGEMVHRRQVGPKPCPISALTPALIEESLTALQDKKTIANAAALAASMSQEDGVEGACNAFYKHLPLENMLCEVSLFRGEYRLAQVCLLYVFIMTLFHLTQHVVGCLQVYCADCSLKMTKEISDLVHNNPSLHLQDHTVGPCCYKDWSRRAPHSAAEGLLQGLGGLVHELKEGVSDLVYDPVLGIYEQGISGAAAGLSSGLNSLLSRPLAGGSVLLSKVKEGIRASLASNLNYGVAASAFDPIAAESLAAAQASAGAGGQKGGVEVSKSAQKRRQNRARELKMSVPALPPVLETVEEVSAVASPHRSPMPSQKDGAVDDAMLSPTRGGRSSPRGQRVLGDSQDGVVGLLASQLSAASHDSAKFYRNKSAGQVGDAVNDEDSDDSSEYCEEETLPFLLYKSDTEAHTVKLPANTSALSSSTPSSHDSPHPAVGDSAATGTAGKGRERLSAQISALLSQSTGPTQADSSVTAGDSLGSQVNHSSGSSPADAPFKVQIEDLDKACPDTATVIVRTAHPPELNAATAQQAYAAAQTAKQLFSTLGAVNGR